jgi:hypothetical protein
VLKLCNQGLIIIPNSLFKILQKQKIDNLIPKKRFSFE